MDSLSNGMIVFVAWFCDFSFFGSSIPSSAIMLSLCTVGIHALGAVVDSDIDALVGQTTIATAFISVVIYASSVFSPPQQLTAGQYLEFMSGLDWLSCFNVTWAHRSFQAIIYLSISSAVYWIGTKLWKHEEKNIKLGLICGNCLRPESLMTHHEHPMRRRLMIFLALYI